MIWLHSTLAKAGFHKNLNHFSALSPLFRDLKHVLRENTLSTKYRLIFCVLFTIEDNEEESETAEEGEGAGDEDSDEDESDDKDENESELNLHFSVQ